MRRILLLSFFRTTFYFCRYICILLSVSHGRLGRNYHVKICENYRLTKHDRLMLFSRFFAYCINKTVQEKPKTTFSLHRLYSRPNLHKTLNLMTGTRFLVGKLLIQTEKKKPKS